MVLERFYLSCLAHASYLVADLRSGAALVVDPQRDIEIYLDAARRHGVSIQYVFLTHFHADFLAGHLELRQATGATICLGSRASAEYRFRAFADRDELRLGEEPDAVSVQVLHTPGHTPESVSLVLREAAGAAPYAVLTGDTLFAGDVGRPDLRVALGWSARALGELLYDSLHTQLLPLPDATLVYPAHGAGSLCGKQISASANTTLGEQRRLNYALQPMSRDQFLNLVLADQPEAPAYFTYDAVLNTQEHPVLEAALDLGLVPLDLRTVETALAAGAVLLDTRSAAEHERAHWRGSWNIPLDGSFATWCGTVLPRPPAQIIVLAEPGREREAAVRLGRIGFDPIAGFVEGGMSALGARPDLIAEQPRLAPAELAAAMDSQPAPVLLDVRTPGERANGAIPGSRHIPLGQLAARRAELDLKGKLIVHCQSGYRSAIACSLLRTWGARDVADLDGGYQAWAMTASAAASTAL